VTARQRVALRAGLWIAASSAVVGATLSVVESQLDLFAIARGALAGLAISMPVYAFDLVLTSTAWGREIRRQPFAVVVAFRTLGYLLLIVLGLALAATVVGAPVAGDGGYLTPVTVGIAVGVAFAANVVWQLNRSLGQGALISLVTGRYHRPHVEERVFLFVDLQGSTAAAERLGPERFLTLLDRIAFDVADAVLEAGGEIHAYVGDEVIVTWLAEDGLRDARCVRGCFQMLDSVNNQADRYHREFGFVPRFHAALHVGPVVVGEMGDLHREIVFLGDTVNTTARIEAASGELHRDVLASRDLIDRLQSLPAWVTSVALGPIALRGKQEPLELCAIERNAPIETGAVLDRHPDGRSWSRSPSRWLAEGDAAHASLAARVVGVETPRMIRLIREHNALNGLRFSVIEFVVMAVVIAGFAVYVANAGGTILAIALLGVGANCLVVAAVGIRSIQVGAEDRSLAATFSPSSRARILQEHPHAQRATWALSVLTLIPFAVAAAVLAGRLCGRAW